MSFSFSRKDDTESQKENIQANFYIQSKGIFIKPVLPFDLRNSTDRIYSSFATFYPFYITVTNDLTEEKFQYQLTYSIDKHCMGLDVTRGAGLQGFHEDPIALSSAEKYIKKILREHLSFELLISSTPYYAHFLDIKDLYLKRHSVLKEIIKRNHKKEKFSNQEYQKINRVLTETGNWQLKGEFKNLKDKNGIVLIENAQKDPLIIRQWITFIHFLYPEEARAYYQQAVKDNLWLSVGSTSFADYDKKVSKRIKEEKEETEIEVIEEDSLKSINQFKF